MSIYIVASLANPQVLELAQLIREHTNYTAFDEWYAAGPEADTRLTQYGVCKGHTYKETLALPFAANIFNFDKEHIDNSTDVVLLLPAGPSAHTELGYAVGIGKRAHIILASKELNRKVDIMYLFVGIERIHNSIEDFLHYLNRNPPPRT